jgi:hypothetical protein
MPMNSPCPRPPPGLPGSTGRRATRPALLQMRSHAPFFQEALPLPYPARLALCRDNRMLQSVRGLERVR